MNRATIKDAPEVLEYAGTYARWNDTRERARGVKEGDRG